MKTHCITLVALLCVALSMPMMMNAVNRDEDDPRCENFDISGQRIVNVCRKTYSEDDPVELLRCIWRDLKEIDIVAEDVDECRIKYPNDETELFCGIEILMCSLEKLINQCPSFREQKNENNNV